MKSIIKQILEKILNARVIRYIPHGYDLSTDIQRKLPSTKILTLFDVGGNIGQSVKTFRFLFPSATIYSFEPVRDTFQKLQQNTASYKNVHVFPLALGFEPGFVEIEISEDSTENSLLKIPSNKTASMAKTEVIQVETLSKVASHHKLKHIDFLKIDAEGFDLEVLKGGESLLEKQAISFIQVEAGVNSLNQKHIPLATFQTYLEEKGYYLFGIYEQRPEWTGEARLRFVNAVFTCLNQ